MFGPEVGYQALATGPDPKDVLTARVHVVKKKSFNLHASSIQSNQAYQTSNLSSFIQYHNKPNQNLFNSSLSLGLAHLKYKLAELKLSAIDSTLASSHPYLQETLSKSDWALKLYKKSSMS